MIDYAYSESTDIPGFSVGDLVYTLDDISGVVMDRVYTSIGWWYVVQGDDDTTVETLLIHEAQLLKEGKH